MMVAALPFVGQGERHTAFQYPDRLVLTLGETANPFDDESHTRSIWSERFLSWRPIYSDLFEEISLDYYRRDLLFSGPNTLVAAAEARPWSFYVSHWCS